MSRNAFKDVCTPTNPRATSNGELTDLYKKSFYGLSK